MPDPHIQLVLSAYDAFQRGDIRSLLALLHEDVTWGIDADLPVPWYHVRYGRSAVPTFFDALAEGLEFEHFSPHDFAVTGALVYNAVDFAATVKGNGAEIELTSVHVWTIREGRIATWRAYEDTAAVLAAVQEGKSHRRPTGAGLPGRPLQG